MGTAFDPVTAAFEIGGKLLERLWPDPTQRAAAEVKLEELRQSGELARMVNATEAFKAEVMDRESAREREAKVATAPESPWLNKIVTPVLALVIMFGVFGGMFYLVGLVDADLNPSQKDVVIYILGALTAMGTQVLSYYFGSSRGDAAKDQVLRDMIRDK